MPGLEPFASHASAFLQWLLIASASATLIAGVVLIVQKIFGGWLTPGGRQRLWVLVIVRLLLPVLPASALSIANLKFEMLWTSAHQEVRSEPVLDQSMVMPIVRAEPVEATHHDVPSPIAQPTRSWNAFAWTAAFVAWAIVVIAMFGRLLWVNRAMSIRLHRAVVVNDQPIIELVRGCAKDAGLRSAPAIVVTDAVATPAVHGIWRPRILMPTALLESLTPTQQRHVILHELSHIRHHDVLGNWLLAILNITHWFNPLLWLTFARIKSDRELARDAWVVRKIEHGDVDTYANTLLDLAQRLSFESTSLHSIAGGSLPQLFGNASSLKRRLHMIARPSNIHWSSRVLSLVILALLACGLLTSARAQTSPSVAGPATITDKPTTRPGGPQPRRAQSRPSVETLTKFSQRAINRGDYAGALGALNGIKNVDPDNVYANAVLPFVQEKLRTVPEDVVQKKLAGPLPSVEFRDVGLGDVVDFLRDIRGINITVNWVALKTVAVTPNSPVTANERNISFDRALRIIFAEIARRNNVKLGYTIASDGLYITTQQELDNSVETITYDISDLLAGNDRQTPQQRSDEIVRVIREFIDHDTWKNNGGTIGVITAANGKLTVVQRPASLRHVEALLKTMRNSRAKKD